MPNVCLILVAGVSIGLVAGIGSPTAEAQSLPARSFEELQLRVHPGDTVAVENTRGRPIAGQVIRVSDASLDLASSGRMLRLDGQEIRRVRLRDPIDGRRVKWGAWLGVLAALACADSPRCAPWQAGDFTIGKLLAFWALCGAGAATGAITAATLDALHRPTIYIAPARGGRTAAPGAMPSSRAVEIGIVLRF